MAVAVAVAAVAVGHVGGASKMDVKIWGFNGFFDHSLCQLVGFVGKNYRKILLKSWENRWFPVKIFP